MHRSRVPYSATGAPSPRGRCVALRRGTQWAGGARLTRTTPLPPTTFDSPVDYLHCAARYTYTTLIFARHYRSYYDHTTCAGFGLDVLVLLARYGRHGRTFGTLFLTPPLRGYFARARTTPHCAHALHRLHTRVRCSWLLCLTAPHSRCYAFDYCGRRMFRHRSHHDRRHLYLLTLARQHLCETSQFVIGAPYGRSHLRPRWLPFVVDHTPLPWCGR